MGKSQNGKSDRCPDCDVAFEIVSVRFTLYGTRVLAACPNCALAQYERADPPKRSAIPPVILSLLRQTRSLRVVHNPPKQSLAKVRHRSALQ